MAREVVRSRSDPEQPDWIELDRKFVWHPYTQMQMAPAPLPVVRAAGAWLELADGRRLLDGTSSWWVNLHGHNHPRLNRALAEQLEQVAQVVFAGTTHEPAARLAAELVERAPPGLGHVFFSDDGSTAVEVAMKMAIQQWRHRGEAQRSLFVALEGAYHGDTFGAMAVGGSSLFHASFRDLLCSAVHVPVPLGACTVERAVEELEGRLAAAGDRVAAVIVEPIVQAAAGMRIYPPSFLAEVRRATRSLGIPLIADEVFTGFGRTGRLFACEHAGVTPDLLCLSKGLTGGYLPLAATLTNDEIYGSFLSDDRARTFFHGHSYTGNALACAVALESLALFESEQTLARIAELERLFAERIDRLSALPAVAEARGIGALAAVELRATAERGYFDSRGPRIQTALVERGVLLRPLGDVVYFLPPYCVSDADCHRVFDALEETLAAL